jgi:hypothetical protein
MQDRTSARSTKPSCNARPDHTLGHFRQIDPLPTLSACPLRSDRVRTFAPQRFDAACRYCCKSAKLPGANFSAVKKSDRRPPIDVAPSRYRGRQRVYLQAMRSPTSLHESRLRPKEFLIASAKRLLQQNLPGADHPPGLKTARFRLAATSVCWIDRPMTLPPGQPPELATRPVPTRSPRLDKVIWRYLADPGTRRRTSQRARTGGSCHRSICGARTRCRAVDLSSLADPKRSCRLSTRRRLRVQHQSTC